MPILSAIVLAHQSETMTSALTGSEARAILVVGASGFVGGHLLAALQEALGDTRLVATGLGGLPISGRVEWRGLDITDRLAVRKLLEEVRPTTLIHLAALATFTSSVKNPDLAWLVNVQGTRNLAEATMEVVPECQFLHVSSSEVYGYSCNRYDWVDEGVPLDPGNVYAVTKAAADLAIGEMARRGLNAVRVRPFNHTGPGQSEALFVPAVAAQIARAERGITPPVIHVGNLETERDFLDVRDVVKAYVQIVRNFPSIPSGTIFNLASGEVWRMRLILNALMSLSQIDLRVEHDPERMRPSEVPRMAGDALHLRRSLSWQPTFKMAETIEAVLQFWRAQVANA